jgi:predicted MFS family arabinose efflux permease
VAVAAFALVSVPAYVLATPLAFGAGWAWPGLFNLSVVRRYPESPGAATGATQTGTYLGAGVGPLVFGMVVDANGFPMAWLGSATLLAAGALARAVGGRRSVPARLPAA